jgi:hypothetical protein
MSIHTGRMSIRDAYTALARVRSIAPVFGEPGAALVNRATALDTGPVDAAAIRALLSDLNELVTARLFASESLAPSFADAIVVTLYGVGGTTDRAFILGAERLGVDPSDLALVDVTPVTTAAVVGYRYTLRVI